MLSVFTGENRDNNHRIKEFDFYQPIGTKGAEFLFLIGVHQAANVGKSTKLKLEEGNPIDGDSFGEMTGE